MNIPLIEDDGTKTIVEKVRNKIAVRDAEITALRAENAELREALELMTALTALHYGNLQPDIYAEIEKARSILAKREWSVDDILKREG